MPKRGNLMRFPHGRLFKSVTTENLIAFKVMVPSTCNQGGLLL